MKYKEIANNKEINAYLQKGNANLGQLGFTDHSQAHCVQVARQAGKILKRLGYSEHEIELAKIAGYMHDIVNCINRKDHAHLGAVVAHSILIDLNMDYDEIAIIMNAIGEHEEKTGHATNPISAALILADKTDVRRDRVQTKTPEAFDQHDRVNYAVTGAALHIRQQKEQKQFSKQLEESICSMMDYFEFFLQRMLMCKRSAEVLHMRFKMTANGNKIC